MYDTAGRHFNVASHFLDHAEPGRTALWTDSGSVTYGELVDVVDRSARVLLELGVGPGDRVLLALSDGLGFVALWFAAQKIGAVTAEVYSYLRPSDFRYYLEYVEPALVVVDKSTVDAMRAAGAPALLVLGATGGSRPGEYDYDELVAAATPGVVPAATRANDITIWKFTTGSTGAPKACMLPAGSALASFAGYARGVLGLDRDDVVLPVPKLFFGYARDLAALFPFGAGAAGVVFAERSTPQLLFELIARHRPTVLVNVPTMMRAMVDHPTAPAQDLSCLRLCTSAGEALPAGLRRQWLETFGVEVVDGIGSAETYHIYLSQRPGRTTAGGLGSVVDGYAVRLVGRDGAEVPPGGVGLMEVRGPAVARGYWRAERAAAATFPQDGVVLTADLFRRHPDGSFSYAGRADDMLKVGGKWVAPLEVEQCLLTHPAVAECAVVGKLVAGLTVVIALVVTTDVVTNRAALPAELIEFAKRHLAPGRAPAEVQLVSALPRTGSGKIDRARLRRGDHDCKQQL